VEAQNKLKHKELPPTSDTTDKPKEPYSQRNTGSRGSGRNASLVQSSSASKEVENGTEGGKTLGEVSKEGKKSRLQLLVSLSKVMFVQCISL